MLRSSHEAHHGQSLVLVALMAVVLIAFVGLTIDGGNAYVQRRIVQNASDGGAIRGAQLWSLRPWRISTDVVGRRTMLLRKIHQGVEAHGIEDTNGIPGDEINENVVAYWTNDEGEPYHDCTIAQCTIIPDDAFGVEVVTSFPFPTYFAGVIGWNEMTVASRAIGLAHVGASGANAEQWAMIALDRQECTPNSTYELDLQGENFNLTGNIHSNNNLALTSNVTYDQQIGDITAAGLYSGTEVYTHTGRIGLVLPDFMEYYQLAYDNAIGGDGFYFNGNYINESPYPSDLGSDGTDGGFPYTFINGSLVLTDTGEAVLLGGLIVVNGNVDIYAPEVGYKPLGYTLLATGKITVHPTNLIFDAYPYEDGLMIFDPLLYQNVNKVSLWSGMNLAGSGDPCNEPAIEMLNAGTNLFGAILAPNGQVVVNNIGPNKQIDGTIIADTIRVDGNNTTIAYNPGWFPPQPDYVELME